MFSEDLRTVHLRNRLEQIRIGRLELSQDEAYHGVLPDPRPKGLKKPSKGLVVVARPA